MGEICERQKEARLQSQCTTWRKTDSGEGTVSSGNGKVPEEVKLELGLPIVGLGIWELLGSNGFILLL